MRDRLPLWVHGALPSDEAGAVAAHVAGCEACAAEVALIRRIAGSLAAPMPDVARIVAALPTAADLRARAARTRRFRFAAAASVLLVASAAVVTLRSPRDVGGGRADAAPQLAVRAEPAMPSIVPDESVTVTLDEPGVHDVPGFPTVSELSDDQLRELIVSLQQIEALPSAQPAAPSHSLVHDTSEDDL
ncbi:MAG: zf-HC2 domain-containing protein [Gemmatimonadetes bacterium]|nr:zf-HC2 domain-containing protein [Gemmatimonadota bacterium]